MNSLTHIAPRVGTVHLPVSLRSQPVPVSIPAQKRGYDSNKKIYTYCKKQNAVFHHNLAWQSMPLTTLNALLAFASIALGNKYDVTWTDHQDRDHTVRIIGQPSWTQNGPDTCRCSMILEETVPVVYGGADGSVLMGSDGTIITW